MMTVFWIILPFAVIGLGAVCGIITPIIYRRIVGGWEAHLFKRWRRLEARYRRKYGTDV